MTTKNKRLSEDNRASLIRLARKLVRETHPSEELDAAYEGAADAIHAIVTAKYPPKDMAVLLKYDAAAPDCCIRYSTGHYDVNQFDFRADDKRIPTVPSRYCNRVPFLVEGAAVEAMRAYEAAKKAYDQGIAQRENDYRALIQNATSFNQVVDVWPEAERLRENICGRATALSVLSEDVIERLKRDAAIRVEEPA